MPSILRALAGLWAALAFSACAYGISLADKTFDEIVAEADEIFIGIADAATSRRLPSGAIVTDTPFRDLRILKGSAAGSSASVMVAGGTIGNETMEVRGVPKFRTGITYLLFVKGNGRTIFPLAGGFQGLYEVRRDPATGLERIHDAWGRPVMRDAQTPLGLDGLVEAIRTRLPAR